ncbi:MAG: hypothetical protein IPN18_11635 [Ignavibacteriales bacterium]|nr:hypothetical protein [Ignavibacteriales bacterium]
MPLLHFKRITCFRKPVEEIVQPLSKPEEIKEVVIRSIEKLKTLNIRKPERTNTILMG